MKRHITGIAAALALSATAAVAQNYPERPITMIVPFAAGGPTDVIARIVGENMSQDTGSADRRLRTSLALAAPPASRAARRRSPMATPS